MPEVNFYLKKPDVYCCPKHTEVIRWQPGECTHRGCGQKLVVRRDKDHVNDYNKKKFPTGDPNRLIYLQFKYAGQKLTFSFGESIPLGKWNLKKQRVKNNRQTTSDGDHLLNDLLDGLASVCEKAYKEGLSTGTLTVDGLKKPLVEFLNKNKGISGGNDLFEFLDRFINGEIKKRKGKDRASGTKSNYAALKLHLQEFATKKRCKVSFDTIDMTFFGKFTSFLQDHFWRVVADDRDKRKKKTIMEHRPGNGLAHNSIAKDIRLLKSAMNKALSYGLTTNVGFRHEDFNWTEEDAESIYLTDTEILRLYQFNFENKRLERERDRFVFGCFTGLRFSDHSRISKQNIFETDDGTYIRIKTQKTGERVDIPCNQTVLEILEKYGGQPPSPISNQKFNKYIKEVCRLAGLTETGRMSTEPDKPLYEFISSHTCRRSFATNLYLDGFPTIDLMKITVHKTEAAFLRYIKHDKLHSAKRLNEHFKRIWKDKLRKAEMVEVPMELLDVANQN